MEEEENKCRQVVQKLQFMRFIAVINEALIFFRNKKMFPALFCWKIV